MLLSGLRNEEGLGLVVRDIDIARGWVKVVGKGDKERRIPVDAEVTSIIQTYLLAETRSRVPQVCSSSRSAHPEANR